MPTILESVKNRILRKRQNERDAKTASVRTVLLQAAYEESGVKVASPLNEDEAVLAMETTEPDVDISATLNRIERRIGWSRKVAQLGKCKAAADAADAAVAAFIREDSERERIARERLPALREAARLAQVAHADAIAAESNLVATAEADPNENELSTQLTKMNHAIDQAAARLNRLGSAEVSRVARAASAREQMRRPHLTPRDRQHLDQQLAAAERESTPIRNCWSVSTNSATSSMRSLPSSRPTS